MVAGSGPYEAEVQGICDTEAEKALQNPYGVL